MCTSTSTVFFFSETVLVILYRYVQVCIITKTYLLLRETQGFAVLSPREKNCRGVFPPKGITAAMIGASGQRKENPDRCPRRRRERKRIPSPAAVAAHTHTLGRDFDTTKLGCLLGARGRRGRGRGRRRVEKEPKLQLVTDRYRSGTGRGPTRHRTVTTGREGRE